MNDVGGRLQYLGGTIQEHDKAILKNMSVGGNPSCCNLEALLENFFQVFLRFTKIYFNDTH